jgi:hypothetical protein
MPAQEPEFPKVFSTGNRLQFDWVCGALHDAGIPYFSQECNVGGLRLAQPAFPTAQPGVSWSIYVPNTMAAQARDLIETLPFDKKDDPGFWDFSPYPEMKLLWKFLAVAMIMFFIVSFIYTFWTLFR